MSLRRTQMCLRRILVSLRRTQMCLLMMMLMTFGAVTMGQICGKRARAPEAVCPKALPSTTLVVECPACGTYLLVAHRPTDGAFGFRLRCACGRWVMRGCYEELADDYDQE